MLNPWFWLEPFFATPQNTMAEAEAAKQKHAEEMINPVPTIPHNRAQWILQAIDDWDQDMGMGLSSRELEDLYNRLKKGWADNEIETIFDTESQAIVGEREKAKRCCGI